MTPRLDAYQTVATALALRSDRELHEFVEAATPLGSGIGGTSALLSVDGVPVFAKRITVTDREIRPEHVRSTANLYDLPYFCHYGLGVPGFGGFGAWRELAAHVITTNWVLAGESASFPLMYHWRVLPHEDQVLSEEMADVEAVIAYYGGGEQVRARIEDLRDASTSITLFLEYFPDNLHDWLAAELKVGADAAERACAMVERELAATTAFMNARGMLHLDAHFQNMLTDGEHLYVADYGLALADRFDLDDAERAFFAEHQDYDRRYSVTHLTIWLITELYGLRGDDRRAYLHAVAHGERPTGIPDAVADVIARHAPTAAVMTEFYRRFQQQSRETPYPRE